MSISPCHCFSFSVLSFVIFCVADNDVTTCLPFATYSSFYGCRCPAFDTPRLSILFRGVVCSRLAVPPVIILGLCWLFFEHCRRHPLSVFSRFSRFDFLARSFFVWVSSRWLLYGFPSRYIFRSLFELQSNNSLICVWCFVFASQPPSSVSASWASFGVHNMLLKCRLHSSKKWRRTFISKSEYRLGHFMMTRILDSNFDI